MPADQPIAGRAELAPPGESSARSIFSRAAPATRRQLRLLLAMVLVFLAVESVVLVALRDDPYGIWSPAENVDSPFFSIVLMSAFVLHLWKRPSWSEVGATVILSAALAGLHAWLRRVLEWEAAPLVYDVFSATGIASFAVLGILAWKGRENERDRALSTIVPAALLPMFILCAQFFLGTTALFHPLVLDPV